jgi:hypothetical protein
MLYLASRGINDAANGATIGHPGPFGTWQGSDP